MIGEFVKYPAPDGITRAEVIKEAEGVVPKWQANPQLIRKHFLWSDDKRWLCGFYFWQSREAAEQAHDAAWCAAVTERTGSAPEISYFDAFLTLDNVTGSVVVDGVQPIKTMTK